ncbi:MAG TPA: hypothetical protein PKA66_05400 [Gemmatimonadales bacterium]|nr:hypothetical protein [Gemmatimonadales bacterium]
MSESIPSAMGAEKVSTTDAEAATLVALPAGETADSVVGFWLAGAVLSLQARVNNAALHMEISVTCVCLNMAVASVPIRIERAETLRIPDWQEAFYCVGEATMNGL